MTFYLPTLQINISDPLKSQFFYFYSFKTLKTNIHSQQTKANSQQLKAISLNRTNTEQTPNEYYRTTIE